jgi:thiol-disulfide isomerase/thioredoxin
MSDELNLGTLELPPEPPQSGWWRWAKDLGILVGGGILVWVGVGWIRAPHLPEVAPPFSLPTLTGGHVALADQQGKTVVLNFFATWCGPCELELPTLTAFATEHPDVPVYYLAVDGSPDLLKTYASTHGMPLSTVVRLVTATHDASGVSTLPTTVVVKPDGKVGGAHSGVILLPQLWWMTR